MKKKIDEMVMKVCNTVICDDCPFYTYNIHCSEIQNYSFYYKDILSDCLKLKVISKDKYDSLMKEINNV